jgi:diguanylate cyclase (GGDEF)-like protein
MSPEPAASGGTTLPGRDAVTGAYPRTLLDECLTRELARARDTGGHCSLFLFDLDHFKSVNDAFGHARGDEVLRHVADRVRALVRDSDMLFRYGGDEFVLVLPGTPAATAADIAVRVAHGVKATPSPGSPPLTVSVSVGVATFPDAAGDGADLLETADRRNYLAKRRGRAQAVADDLASEGGARSARLLDCDLPLAAGRRFLDRLAAGDSGMLRVAGEPGAGHSRFLTELGVTAELRSLRVRAYGMPGGPAATATTTATATAAATAATTAATVLLVDAGAE